MIKEENITEEIKIPENLEILKKYFSSCFDKNGEFKLEKFKEELKLNEINLSKEGYGLEWLGKSYSRVLTFEPARTLLKENEEWNKKEDNRNSGNLLIKGDNLEVLKHLINAYHEKIKMIYIDPPYNTGNDGFIYQDDRKFTVQELIEITGVDKERAKRILDFVNSKSNSHSAWLTFVYPRLYIVRQLLKEDGVIFVSIDDNEVAQLRILMDEIFGEENFVGFISVVNNLKGRSDDAFFATANEFLLVYAKNKNILKINGFEIEEEEIDSNYDRKDEIGYYKLIGFRKTGKGWERHHRPHMYYPILEKNGKFYSIEYEEFNKIYDSKNKIFNDDFVKELIDNYKNKGFNVFLPLDSKNNKGRWRWGFDKYRQNLQELELNDNNTVCTKMRATFEDGSIRLKTAKTIWYKPEYDTGSAGKLLKRLFNSNVDIFENPKSVIYLKDIFKLINDKNSIILDFFAGSGTTGHAVMQLNAEDGGNRKYILVQLPEPIDEKKNKTAYDFVKNELGVENPTIFDITKERLIRAAKKIKEETIAKKIEEKEKEIKTLQSQLDIDDNKEKIKQLKEEIANLQNQDLGFKVFETIPIWEDYLTDENELSEKTKVFNKMLFEDDLKALLLTWKTYDGIALTEDYKEITLNNYTAYYCGTNLYLIHNNWQTENIKALLEKIDYDKDFVVEKIIVFGYSFDSKHLREIEENVRNYANKKQIEIETILRF